MLIPSGAFSFFSFFLSFYAAVLIRETCPKRFEQFEFDSFREFHHGSMVFTMEHDVALY